MELPLHFHAAMICYKKSYPIFVIALMLAAYAGNVEIVDFLLRRGANAHTEDQRGRKCSQSGYSGLYLSARKLCYIVDFDLSSVEVATS